MHVAALKSALLCACLRRGLLIKLATEYSSQANITFLYTEASMARSMAQIVWQPPKVKQYILDVTLEAFDVCSISLSDLAVCTLKLTSLLAYWSLFCVFDGMLHTGAQRQTLANAHQKTIEWSECISRAWQRLKLCLTAEKWELIMHTLLECQYIVKAFAVLRNVGHVPAQMTKPRAIYMYDRTTLASFVVPKKGEKIQIFLHTKLRELSHTHNVIWRD